MTTMDRRVFVGARVRPRQGREREMDAEVRNCVVVDAEVSPWPRPTLLTCFSLFPRALTCASGVIQQQSATSIINPETGDTKAFVLDFCFDSTSMPEHQSLAGA